MRLDLLAKQLQDAGLGTMGTDIFIHRLDETVQEGMVLRLPIMGIDTDYSLPGYYKSTIQVIVRSAKQSIGDTRAKAVKACLTTLSPRTYNDENGDFAMQLNQMFLEKLPIIYPRSEGHLTEWSLNFAVNFVIPE